MVSFKFTSAISGLLAITSTVHGYANPEPCSGDCHAKDPSLILRDDGTYFRFNTGNGVGILKSSSLDGPWTFQGDVMPSGSSINLPGKDNIWAPDVHKVGDQYILYYAVSTLGSQTSAIGYATSSNLEYGSWTDHGTTGIQSSSSSPYNAIDPSMIQVGTTSVMNFGSYWNGIYQVGLKDETTINAAALPAHQLAYNATGLHSIEGSYMFFYGNYFYLFFSSGQCCDFEASKPPPVGEYKVFVCRSPSVAGPFVDQNGVDCTQNGGTLVLASHDYVYAPGGEGVFADPTHGTVIYYHYANPNIGMDDAHYQFGWNTINWVNGWPTV